MGKTKIKSRSNSKDILRSTNAPIVKSVPQSQRPVEELLVEASDALERSEPEVATLPAQEALRTLEATQDNVGIDTLLEAAAQGKPTLPLALVLNADINLALGQVDKARSQYKRATNIDGDGALISAEPWLQLAQLCEEGGKKSIEYFDKAIEVMKNEIEVLQDEEAMEIENAQQILDTRRCEVADALCGMAEVYMTDLSWEENAEASCERLVTEAVAVCPEDLSSGVLQTLASVRISQQRLDDARQALNKSMQIWKDLPEDVEDHRRPDFASRISLARLLMETEVESDAMNVLEGLVKEDDQSVEAWYLGGWCQVLLSQKLDILEDEDKARHIEQARTWLGNCLKLYELQGYEDERLRNHAEEIVHSLNKALGVDEDGQWEDTDDEDEVGEQEQIEIEANGVHEDVEMT